MKKIITTLTLVFTAFFMHAQEYAIITTVESIVPGGIGRSRMISSLDTVNYNYYTTNRYDGKKSDQGSVNRKDLKINQLSETKLLNFYSMVGINFQNIASNDAIIESKLTEMAKNGWKLVHVVSGVESDAGKDDGEGIFITRYIFYRE
jgi:hypothetical protein